MNARFTFRALPALLGLIATSLLVSCDCRFPFFGTQCPAIVGAEALSSTEIRLTWKIEAPTTAYKIWQRRGREPFQVVQTVDFEGQIFHTVVISDLEPGTSYDFSVHLAEQETPPDPGVPTGRRASATTLAARAPVGGEPEAPGEMAPLIAPPAAASGVLAFTVASPHVEFRLTTERRLQITFLDEEDNLSSLPGQPITVRLVDPSQQSALTFAMAGRVLTSDLPLPDGEGHRLAARYTGISDHLDVLPPLNEWEPLGDLSSPVR